MELERWKDEVMKSASGLKRAEPNPFLFTRIEVRIENLRTRLNENRVPAFKVSLALASIALLAILNFSMLKRFDNQDSTGRKSTISFSSVNYQLY